MDYCSERLESMVYDMCFLFNDTATTEIYTDTLFPYTTLFRSDYTREQGVEHSELMLPTDAPEWAADRERLWNAAELAETRKNATVAREYEIALPVELSADERRELALGIERDIRERQGVAVDVSSPAPGREGDPRKNPAHPC